MHITNVQLSACICKSLEGAEIVLEKTDKYDISTTG